ncbi:MAG: dTDP-4-dehydrorhamnose reductase [Anaerolineaceae bacterium]|nr:dTDP-4-dehydrorhamnose reductase [Anaerolineaceae bacterium]
MRILITGAAGRLGGRLVEILTQQGHDITGTDLAGDEFEHLDVTNYDTAHRFIVKLRPDVVIHPAAWTDVDGCAREPEKAIQINGFGAQHVALGAAAIGAAVVYISSNEVFDGKTDRPYREYDPTCPANPYGYSKWVGEQAVQHTNPRHYIVRTAWLFAHGGKNFIHAILNAVAAGKPLRVVTDEVANPTYNDDLAEAITQLIDTERYGIYHLVNDGACSRYDFARYFLDKAGHTDTPITAITSDQWPRASVPPAYAPMQNMAGQQIGVQLRPWQQAVDDYLAREGLLR